VKFFEFRQNNTGGSFEFDADAGISVHVIIEADSGEDANRRAKLIGLYFDGVDEGQDCPCCGDRWYGAWSSEGTDTPMIYRTPVQDVVFGGGWDAGHATRWMSGDEPEVYVHFANGTVQGYGFDAKVLA
jgi:hypothetical protein